MSSNKTIEAFQGLRGYAILLIFISHCNLFCNSSGTNIFNWAGALGVSCFIFLSGFLAVIQHKNGNFFKSFAKKIKKFYPLHILTLAIAVIISIKALIPGNITAWLALLSNLTLTHALIPLPQFYFSFNAVSWYLSLTVIFILFTPLIIKIADKLKKHLLLSHIIFFSIIILEFLWCFLIGSSSYSHYLVYIFPFARLLDLLLGATVFVLADAYKDKIKFSGIGVILTSIILLILLAVSTQTESKFFAASIWSLPVAALMAFLYIGNENSKIINITFKNKIIVGLGNISFEFFLIHQLIIKISEKIFEKIGFGKSIWLYLLTLVMSVTAAFILSKIRSFKPKKKQENTIN